MRKCCLGVALVSLAVNSGCRTMRPKSASSIKEFQPLKPSASTKAIDVTLHFAGDATYESYRDIYDWGRGSEDPHLRIEFPNISETQFRNLKKAYGFGLSHVTYRKGTTYDLRDFLTPMMQAVLNQRFRDEINSNYVHLTSNCWSTAYEVLHTAVPNASSFSVFLQKDGRPLVRGVANASPKHAPILKANSLSAVSQVPDLRFGDILFQYDAAGALEHAAVVVDRDIYFEKTAIITESPYRLVHAADWFYPLESGGAYELWRINPRNLERPSTLFHSVGLRVNGPVLETPDFPLLEAHVSWQYDSMGRARLEPRAFQPLILDKPPGY